MSLKDNIPFQINRVTTFLSRLTRIVLTFSSTTLFISTILYMIYRQRSWTHDSIPCTIISYTIFVSLFSILFAFIFLILLFIYWRRRRQAIWPSIKKEVVLLILTIGLLFILAFTIYTINTKDGHRY